MAYTKSQLDSIIKYYEEGFQKPWSQFTPKEKVDIYNERGITPEDFATYGASVDTETLNYMKGLGYKPYSYGFQSFDTAEERDQYIRLMDMREEAAKRENLVENADTATNLIEQSMMTGVPSNAFDPYGGYQAALDYYLDKGGGTLSLDSPTITRTEIEDAAKKIAETGQGNLAVLDVAKQFAAEDAAKKAAADAKAAADKAAADKAAADKAAVGPTATGAGLSALTTQPQGQDSAQGPAAPAYGFRSPYQAPTQLAPAKGLGSLVSQYVGQPNLRTTTRSIGPSGMGTLTQQPSAALAYAVRPGGIGETQYFQNIKDFFADPNVTPESTAEQMYRYNIPETDVLAAIGMTPTQFFAQKQLAAEKATTQPTASNAGIASITPPPIAYASPGFTAPSQGGLSYAMQPGGIGRTQYLNNIASYLNKGVSPSGLAADMSLYGVTADDLIAARSMFPGGAPNQLGAPISVAPDEAPPAEPKRAGGPITFAEGGKTEMAGEKKFSFEDFGLTPATVETARAQKIFDYPRNVLFNPELRGLEALVASRMTPRDYEDLLIRQGRTGREYASYLPDIRVGGAATGNVRPLNYYYAEGGDVGRGLGSIAMKGYAQEMAQKGRFGDTMLAHISPDEAQMLKAMGGSGTINPATGLPEYFSWRKLLKGVGKVLPFVLPFTGIGLGAQALIGGLSGAVSGGKGFDFKRGLMSGLMSYGMGSLAQGAGAAGGVPVTDPSMAAGQSLAGEIAAPIVGEAPKFASVLDSSKGFLPQLGENIQAVGQGAMGAATGAPGAREAFTAGQGSVFGKQVTPTMAAGATAVGMGGVKAADEMNAFEAQQAALTAKTDEEKKYYEDLFRRLMPPGYADGGDIMALVGGGATGPANAPRTVNGAGDGMSDSVPATIEGIQEARLADGEFVIPADVVADLGNGSSNAGSKKLYAMMDRIRQARHGTTEQPPEVNMGRLMPA